MPPLWYTVYPEKYAHGFALLCFVVVIHWLIVPYPSGLLHWHWGNLTIAPVPAEQPWWIWINTSCEFIMNDCITTTKQSTTKPCAYFLGYTVLSILSISPPSLSKRSPWRRQGIDMTSTMEYIAFSLCLTFTNETVAVNAPPMGSPGITIGASYFSLNMR